MYKFLIRPLLFLLPAETAHHFAGIFLRFFGWSLIRPFVKSIYRKNSTGKGLDLMGIHFPSRLGLAAGFDKNANMYKGLSAIGFGFIEIGTVTPKAQPGNPKPRLFRLKADGALINRMGFNNDGALVAADRLKNRSKDIVIGGNIGKNKMTPNEEAMNDYVKCFNTLFPFVDYFVVNVSSPNTPGLRELQDKEPLLNILKGLQDLNSRQERRKPILLKIAPDLSEEQLRDIVDIVKESDIEGVIATNTTISRENLNAHPKEVESIGNGGLSGQPLKERSKEVVAYLRSELGKDYVIVGVGGISSPQDALEFIEAGADLVQIYTAFIYGGPALVGEINKKVSVL